MSSFARELELETCEVVAAVVGQIPRSSLLVVLIFALVARIGQQLSNNWATIAKSSAPGRFWMLYEKYIRKAAGLGKAPVDSDPDYYDKENHHCDILVVGSGPSGMIAALEAGLSGADVIIADDQSEMGGSLLYSNHSLEGKSGFNWAKLLENKISTKNGSIHH